MVSWKLDRQCLISGNFKLKLKYMKKEDVNFVIVMAIGTLIFFSIIYKMILDKIWTW
jgi:hypothetical protein